MISCQLYKIFKSTFFIEHLQWLLLAILKFLDSQRQLCKCISKLATIYVISTFCWHCSVFFWQVQAFLLHLDALVFEQIWRFWFFTWPHNWSFTWLFGWGCGPCECGNKTFWLDTRPLDWCVTWLCRWGPVILSHHPAKFGIHWPCESGNITPSTCLVTTILKCDMILWVASPHPKWLSH